MIKKLFSKMFRQRFVHAYFGAIKPNQLFLHEGRKMQKLDATRACTTSWPVVILNFAPDSIVIAIYH